MEKRGSGIASLIYLSLGVIGLIICIININTNPILCLVTLILSIIVAVFSAFNLITIFLYHYIAEEMSEQIKEDEELLTAIKKRAYYLTEILLMPTLILIILTIVTLIL